MIRLRDLARAASVLTTPLAPEDFLSLLNPVFSARQLRGVVTRVVRDTVMAQVDVQAGPHRLVSLMSREAADDLGLEVGSVVVASVKATNVVVELEDRVAGLVGVGTAEGREARERRGAGAVPVAGARRVHVPDTARHRDLHRPGVGAR